MGSHALTREVTASRDEPVVAPSTVAPGTRETLATRGLFVLAVILMGVEYWYPMLSSDLRFDENLTGWVVSGSLVETIERAWVHQGQSPLYFMGVWVWQSLVGSSEIALRLPSMIALFVSVWQLHVLGRELDHPRVGRYAAIFLLVVETGATDARPYVFMILALVVSARFGFLWLERNRLVDGVVWVVAAAVAIAMQPFAVFALVPHAMLVYRACREGRSRSVIGFAVLGAALVAPIVPQVLMLRARQDTLVIADVPTVLEFLIALLPGQLCAGLVLGAMLDRRPVSTPLRARPGVPGFVSVGFVLLWAVMPAFGLFAQSHLTGSSVFVERYFVAALPATAIVLSMFLARVNPRAGLLGAAAVVVVGVVLVDPVGSRDWYGAVDALEDVPADAAIWTVTGYVESDNPDAFANDDANEYLNAPLRWHGSTNDLRAIPRTDIDANRHIIDDRVDDVTSSDVEIVVVVESVEGEVRQTGPEYAQQALLAKGFEVVERNPEFAVLITTFVSR